MRFSSIRFEPGGGNAGTDDEIWPFIQINLETDEPDASRPQVRVDIPVAFSSETTLGELREQFRGNAVAALRAAADALEANEWPELLRLSAENTDRWTDAMIVGI